MLLPDFPLRTARLEYRPYAESDLDFIHGLESNPVVMRYVSTFDPRDREQARASLTKKIGETALRAEGDNLTPVVVLPETGQPIGDVQLTWTSREHRQGEIGYIIHPDHTGNGYATEAAGLMLRLGFEGLGLHRIEGRLDARNQASARVLERLGMRREGCLEHARFVRGEWTDELIYAILEHEWLAQSR
jgi:RimJ/RimL family protein N-acetyltransferase